ncbi:peptidase domain-containing ABC transporter [Thalassotalea sp. ND16A]|uniref:peptidase domain-containing ABC transporter n=1 Tax=Thalassotalea sp. ND16A TaxID=1535422 RepID=UPI00051D601D|nr:peptidase domain-containing ABC transporter [Thalassotalea sp. ND16A]KGJ92484.1 Peptide-transporting ATPase [Thalassotalea sp. ND16A]
MDSSALISNPVSLLRFKGFSRLPLILQTEAAECGLAAIAMVANFYGLKTDLNWLRQHFSISLKGASLQQLMNICAALNFSSRALRLELNDLKKLTTPCVLHWDLNHFVVLKKVTGSYIVIHDPAFGEKKLKLTQVSKHFTGVALEMSPNKDFKKSKQTVRMKLSDFYSKMTGLIPSLLKVFLLSVLLQMFALTSPYYMQLVVDEVILSQDSNLLLVLALGFALLGIIELATKALRSTVILHFSNVLNIQMAANLFQHLLRLPLSFFEKRHIGDVVARFSSLQQVKDMLTTGIIEAVVDGLMAIATLVMIFLYSPTLAAIVCIAIGSYAIVRAMLFKPLKQLSEETIVARAKEQSNFMESVRGIQSIKLFGGESQRQNLWHNAYAEQVNCSIQLGKFQIHFGWLNDGIFVVENVLVVYFAATLVISGELTVGMLFAFMSYKRQFIAKMVNLIEKLIEFNMLSLHLNRLADIAQCKQEANLRTTAGVKTGDNHTDAVAVTVNNSHFTAPANAQLSGEISLVNVGFQYCAHEPLLFQQINLNIAQGESVAIIGPSGCGKTTLLKLMLGLFTPSYGKVCVSDVDIKHLGLSHYRSQISAVMQDDQLLSGSIVDNICFFAEQVDFARVTFVAQLAAIDKDIAAMPMGYNSLVGDMGNTLSGGQKQRLLLARALYKQPKILFLDEATSHLDSEVESLVNHAVKQLNITRIIIAHRLDTILSADKIYSFQQGQLIEVTEKIRAQQQQATG